jgi:hypothetical protein
LMITTLREYVAYGRHHACITHQPQLLQYISIRCYLIESTRSRTG